MKIRQLHNWNLSTNKAAELQKRLSSSVITKNSIKNIKTIAGADVAFKGRTAYAVVIVYSFPLLKKIEHNICVADAAFPYIPGLLSFREAPALLGAFKKTRISPDVIIFDGQGIAHPRRFGIASHMGLLLDKPTIGCAKSKLIGEYIEPGNRVGNTSPLIYNGKQIGAVLRTRENVKPIFVSVGHKLNLKTSVEIITACLDGKRLPKPVREADKLSKFYRCAATC